MSDLFNTILLFGSFIILITVFTCEDERDEVQQEPKIYYKQLKYSEVV